MATATDARRADSGLRATVSQYKVHPLFQAAEQVSGLASQRQRQHPRLKFFAEPPAPPPPAPEPESGTSWFGNVGRGILERGADLAGGMLSGVSSAAEWLDRNVPLGYIDFEKGYQSGTMPAEKDAVAKAGEALTETKFGYEERTSWDEFLDSPVRQFIPYALEKGFVSAPDMAAALINLPGYVVARTGEMSSERAANDARDRGTTRDFLTALPFAVASGALERIGAQRLFGITDTLKDRTIKEVGKAALRRTAIEGLTEAMQEPLEATAANIGTQRWAGMTPGQVGQELATRAAQGGVVGLGMGGTVGSATAAGQAALGLDERSLAARQGLDEAADFEQEAELPPQIAGLLESMPNVIVPPVDPEATGAAPSTIVRRNGTPYPSRRAARLAKRGRRVPENYQPVPVDGGGWALAPQEAPSAETEAEAGPPVEAPVEAPEGRAEAAPGRAGLGPAEGRTDAQPGREAPKGRAQAGPGRPAPKGRGEAAKGREASKGRKKAGPGRQGLGPMEGRTQAQPGREAPAGRSEAVAGREPPKGRAGAQPGREAPKGRAGAGPGQQAPVGRAQATPGREAPVGRGEAAPGREGLGPVEGRGDAEPGRPAPPPPPINQPAIDETPSIPDTPPPVSVTSTEGMTRIDIDPSRMKAPGPVSPAPPQDVALPEGAVVTKAGAPYRSMAAARLGASRPDLKGKGYTPQEVGKNQWVLMPPKEPAQAPVESPPATPPAAPVAQELPEQPPNQPSPRAEAPATPVAPEPTPEPVAPERPPPAAEAAPAPETKAKPRPKDWGAKNKVFTRERHEANKARMREIASRLSSGVDPELLIIGTQMAGYHLEAGARKFADFATEMARELDEIADGLGEKLRPYFRNFYNGARDWPETEFSADMSPAEEVVAWYTAQETTDEQGGPGGEPVAAGVAGTAAPGADGGVPGPGAEGVTAPGAAGVTEPAAGSPGPAGADERGGAGADDGAAVRKRGKRAAERVGDAAGDGTGGVERQNWIIEPGSLDEGRGQKAKAHDNVAAIELAKRLTLHTARNANPQEQAQLARYVGWGGIKAAFPQAGKFGKGFEKVGGRLRELLDPQEYQTAERSIQYAHYTSEPVVRSMWNIAERLGFKGGSVIEPGMGVGHFAGMMPGSVRSKSTYHGIEMDGISATIAQLLYPKHGIQRADYTQIKVPENQYDLAIGNPPFADIAVRADKKYAKHRFLLHDYFFAKSLDAVKPGGLLMFISSAGTMNKQNTAARQYLADRADLVGAIRLPNTAFAQNAGTEVTTDIVVLRKREPDQPAFGPAWVDTVEVTLPNAEGVPTTGAVNQYFAEHPEMVLGEQGFFDKLYQGRYAVRPREGEDFVAALAEAIERLPRGNERAPAVAPSVEYTPEVDLFRGTDKEGTLYVKDGKLFRYTDGAGTEVRVRGKGVKGGMSKRDYQVASQLAGVRDALREVMVANLERNEAAGKQARAELRKVYDAFRGEHGPLNTEKVTQRRPSVIQQENARAHAREDARLLGVPFSEGSFDATSSLWRGEGTAAIARARKAAREQARVNGWEWDEGTFEPDSMPPVVSKKLPNLDPFKGDPEIYRLAAMEVQDKKTEEWKPGPVFERNILAEPVVREIRNARDAMMHALNATGRFDIEEVARVNGRSVEQTIFELGDNVYQDPSDAQWRDASEYLSGDVKTKLEQAQAAVELDPEFARNIEALERVIPEDLVAAQIKPGVGSPWVPREVYVAFAEHLGMEAPTISYNKLDARWAVSAKAVDPSAAVEWGTERSTVPELVRAVMNRAPSPKHYDRVDDRDVLNKKQTDAAAAKYEMIQEEWERWVYDDQAREEVVVDAYNRILNRYRDREFDGSYLTMPGTAAGWQWRPYQLRVIARIIATGNTYMAHAVGAGKTSAMIGAAMEMKRLGLIKKPLFSVPKSVIRQFATEWLHQYPAANLAVADPDTNFHTDRRRQFVANAALDDSLDGIIMTHSSFEMVPVSAQFEASVISAELDKYRMGLEELGKGGDRVVRAQIQKGIERLEQRLRDAGTREKDQTFTWEEMGADQLFVDEAHMFRKLGFTSMMGTIKGIDTQGSLRAQDLFLKTRYLNTMRQGRGVVFASGTPITNTMGELYSISRYLQDPALEARGMAQFDAWARTFGDTAEVFEDRGDGRYRYSTRFVEFRNLPELRRMVAEVADVVLPKDIDKYVVRPALKGGSREMVIAEKTPDMEAFQDTLTLRIKAIEARLGPPQKGDDILPAVANDGRKAAIDLRLIDPDMPNDPGSKLNQMIGRVFTIWKESKDQPFHAPDASGVAYEDKPLFRGPAAQIVFSALGQKTQGGFSVPAWFFGELQRRGVPANEMADIRNFSSLVARKRLYNDLREGKVRILFGHPETLGTGVNVQDRLVAAHNLDALWYPALDEQRVGRIIRQGNMNPEVQVLDYATQGTYDYTMWSLMAKKAKFIEDFWTGDDSVREIEDVGAATIYEQAAGAAAGDPRLQQAAELKGEVKKLENARIAWQQKSRRLKQNISKAQDQVQRDERRLESLGRDIAKRVDTRGEAFAMSVRDATGQAPVYRDRKEGAAALMKAIEVAGQRAARGVSIAQERAGTIGGFTISLSTWDARSPMVVSLTMEHASPTLASDKLESLDGKSIVSSAEAFLRNLEKRVESTRESIEKQKGLAQKFAADMEAARAPFPREAELREKRQIVQDIERALAAETVARQQAEEEAKVAADAPEVLASRRRGAKGGPLGYAGVNAAIAPIVRGWGPTAPRVRIVESWTDLPPPLRAAVEAAGGEVDGLYGGDSTVYLVADQITSAEQARRVLAHEVVGHYSLMEMLGDDFQGLLADTLRLIDRGSPVLKRYAAEVRERYGNLDEDTFAAEVLARAAEDGVKHPLVSRLIAAVRRFLRSLGLKLAFTYAEVQAMLARARSRLQSAGVEPAQTPPSFEGEGYMHLAWHGSPHRFDQFTTDAIGSGEGQQAFGWGLYFADQKEVADHYKEILAKKGEGAVYRVDLAPTDADYLQWDLPVDKQPAKVRQAIMDIAEEEAVERVTMFPDITTAGQAYELIVGYGQYYPSPQETSENLLARGVRGVKYFNANALDGGGSEFNYVIFDPGDIQVEQVYFSRRRRSSPAQERQRTVMQRLAQARLQPVDRLVRAFFVPFGGTNERGEWKPGVKLSENMRKAIRETKPSPDGPFSWLNPALETARAGWLNRYGVDREYIQRERQSMFDRGQIERMGVAFIEQMNRDALHDSDFEVLQNILEGAEVDDARLSALAAPVRAEIDRLGRELVDLGYLSEQTWQQNLGSYLHRSYMRYEQDATALEKFMRRVSSNRRRRIAGDELRMRGEKRRVPGWARLLKDIPKKFHGEARDAKRWHVFEFSRDGERVEKRVFWPDTLVVPERFQETGWSERDAGWELMTGGKGKGLILRRDWTKEEREQMGEIRDARYNVLKTFQLLAHDVTTGKFFEDIAANPDWFTRERPESGVVVSGGETRMLRTYSDVEWVHVPGTEVPGTKVKRYGALAGGYLRAPYWRELEEVNRMMSPSWWRSLMTFFKSSKTSLTPTVHFYNTVGNFFLMDMNDITLPDLMVALEEYRGKGVYLREADEWGIFNVGFARNELQREQFEPLMRDIVREAEARADGADPLTKVWRVLALINDKMVGAYSFEDEIFRLASYIKDRSQGLQPQEASQYAIDRFLNYDIRAPWPNWLRRFLLPFFSYTYAGVPAIARANVLRPWKLAKLFILGYTIGQVGYWLTGSDEEEHRELLPERDKGYTWAGLPRVMRIPVSDSRGNPMDIELQRFIPGGGFLNTEFGQASLPEFMLIGGPVSMAMDLYTNRINWSGEEIVNREIATGLEATQKRALYLWRAMAPNWPIPGAGTWSGQMMERAITGERDFFGRQYSVPQALLRAAGVKVKSFDVSDERMLRAMDRRRTIGEWRRYMWSTARDYGRGRISKSTHDARMRKAQEGIESTMNPKRPRRLFHELMPGS